MTRRSRDYYKPGDWNAICDSCGFKFKASELRKRWDGMMVCQEDWEPRHPQDFLRARKDRQAVPWTRPEHTDNFITVPYASDTPPVVASTWYSVFDQAAWTLTNAEWYALQVHIFADFSWPLYGLFATLTETGWASGDGDFAPTAIRITNSSSPSGVQITHLYVTNDMDEIILSVEDATGVGYPSLTEFAIPDYLSGSRIKTVQVGIAYLFYYTFFIDDIEFYFNEGWTRV